MVRGEPIKIFPLGGRHFDTFRAPLSSDRLCAMAALPAGDKRCSPFVSPSIFLVFVSKVVEVSVGQQCRLSAWRTDGSHLTFHAPFSPLTISVIICRQYLSNIRFSKGRRTAIFRSCLLFALQATQRQIRGVTGDRKGQRWEGRGE